MLPEPCPALLEVRGSAAECDDEEVCVTPGVRGRVRRDVGGGTACRAHGEDEVGIGFQQFGQTFRHVGVQVARQGRVSVGLAVAVLGLGPGWRDEQGAVRGELDGLVRESGEGLETFDDGVGVVGIDDDDCLHRGLAAGGADHECAAVTLGCACSIAAPQSWRKAAMSSGT